MKKMRNGRRGFTLVEIVLVVAIIVILSSAAFFGVAATVNNAHEAQKNLSLNNANNFEAHARNQVDAIGKGAVYWDPIPNYTPENQAKKIKEQMIAEGWTDGEITFEYQTDGWHIVAEWDPTLEAHRGFQTPEDYKLWLSNYNSYLKAGYTEAEIEAGCKNGSTEINPVWNPDNHGGKTYEEYHKQNGTQPTEPKTVDEDPPKTVDEDPPKTVDEDPPTIVKPDNVPDTSSGRPSGKTTVTNTYGTNASGSSVKPKDTWNDGKSQNGNFNFPKKVSSVVVYIPDGVNISTNTAQSTSLGDGYYRWTFQWSNQYSTDVYYSYSGSTTLSDSGFYIVEYTEG